MIYCNLLTQFPGYAVFFNCNYVLAVQSNTLSYLIISPSTILLNNLIGTVLLNENCSKFINNSNY